ncbi:hypothetical protein [Neomicrococcus lactis]|uniref:Uncharacterized protein n=1 Tax=Neomicrococcus lactis TaxID=732241 RepID=A0A7W8YAX2_9MICC|nr:hypothetical protein [Neomicrococcus lactis]MBB5598062.1 hypothetical protein [Neomicrococcus lactis]
MNKKLFLAVPFAVALAVTGCSSNGNSSASSTSASTASSAASTAASSSSASEATSSSAASSETAAASSSASAGDSIGGYTADELEAIVTKLSKGATGAVVMSESKLASTAKQSEELIKSMKITPAKCADLQAMTDITSKLNQVNLAGYQAADETTGESSGITLTSYPDTGTLDSDASKFSGMATDCKSYTLEMSGVSVKADVSTLDVSSTADKTEALQQDLEIMGQKVSTFIAQASKGNVSISATTTGADAKEGAKKLAELVDAAVAELK